MASQEKFSFLKAYRIGYLNAKERFQEMRQEHSLSN